MEYFLGEMVQELNLFLKKRGNISLFLKMGTSLCMISSPPGSLKYSLRLFLHELFARGGGNQKLMIKADMARIIGIQLTLK